MMRQMGVINVWNDSVKRIGWSLRSAVLRGAGLLLMAGLVVMPSQLSAQTADPAQPAEVLRGHDACLGHLGQLSPQAAFA